MLWILLFPGFDMKCGELTVCWLLVKGLRCTVFLFLAIAKILTSIITLMNDRLYTVTKV